MFQLRFYALVVHRATGAVPGWQLLYLGKRSSPTNRTPRISSVSNETGGPVEDHQTGRGDSGLASTGVQECRWCSHQALCPEFGELSPLPDQPSVATSLTVEG